MEPAPQSDTTLLKRLAAVLEGDEPQGPQRALILRLARDIAHAGERQDAPLSTFMVGRYVQMREAHGVSAAAALAEAAELVGGLVPAFESRDAT